MATKTEAAGSFPRQVASGRVREADRDHEEGDDMTIPAVSHPAAQAFVKNVHGVRYQVKDVARSVAFYTEHLGFKLEHQQLPAFASVSLGEADILLSGPGASGSRPMANGQAQEPGGWNRVVLRVSDLPACIAALENVGVHFRNGMESGPGGRQIQIEDPDGNPIELFEPVR
jgi:glyoxylase I family protein